LTAAPNGDRQLQARTLLAYLHRQYPEAYGSGYNIAANDFTLSAYEALDYHTVFRQIEMKYRLQGP
jgi:hypothetical protein